MEGIESQVRLCWHADTSPGGDFKSPGRQERRLHFQGKVLKPRIRDVDISAVSTHKNNSILASTLVARILGYHISFFDQFRFIDMTRKCPFGNDLNFNILGFGFSRFFVWG
jgi:hypothetical protein